MKPGLWLEKVSPAKINLFLVVHHQRQDGYHELTSLMCPVTLADRIYINFDADRNTVVCGAKGVPENEDNLALKALKLFARNIGKDIRAAIRINKQIPVAAGLGGGSSNAAAVLTAFNQRFGEPFNQRQMMEMAVQLGADVPFFILNKPALATGIGEQLVEYRHLNPFNLLIVTPEIQVFTAQVFKNLNLRLTKCKNTLKIFSFKHKFNPALHLCNDLEAVTEKMHPIIGEIKKSLVALGADGVLMSGSGPAVFGIFHDEGRIKGAESGLQQYGRVIRCRIAV